MSNNACPVFSYRSPTDQQQQQIYCPAAQNQPTYNIINTMKPANWNSFGLTLDSLANVPKATQMAGVGEYKQIGQTMWKN